MRLLELTCTEQMLLGDYSNAIMGGPEMALEKEVWVRIAVILAEISRIQTKSWKKKNNQFQKRECSNTHILLQTIKRGLTEEKK